MEYHITDSAGIRAMMHNHYDYFNHREAVKELGEPLFVELGDTWIFDDKDRGFMAYNDKRVKYLYVRPLFRKFGLGGEFISKLPEIPLTLVATINSKRLFEKAGFTVDKAFTNYFKMSRK